MNAIRRWLGSHHLSTWFLVASLVTNAMLLRLQPFTALVFVFSTALMVIARDLARLEGTIRVEQGKEPSVLRRSTLIALALVAIVIILLLVAFHFWS